MLRKITDRCVCGHEYGGHVQTGRQRCTEASAARPSHNCACDEFRLPASHAKWDGTTGGYTEKILLAASSAIDQENERAMRRMDVRLPGGDSELSMMALIE